MSASDDLAQGVLTWWGYPAGWGAFSLDEISEGFNEAVGKADFDAPWPLILRAMVGMVFARMPWTPEIAQSYISSWLSFTEPEEWHFPSGRWWWMWHYPGWSDLEPSTLGEYTDATPPRRIRLYPYGDYPEWIMPWIGLFHGIAEKVGMFTLPLRYQRMSGNFTSQFVKLFISNIPGWISFRQEWTPFDLPKPDDVLIPGEWAFTGVFQTGIREWAATQTRPIPSVSAVVNADDGWLFEGFGAGVWHRLHRHATG